MDSISLLWSPNKKRRRRLRCEAEANPINCILNWLLGFLIVFFLWNLWTGPMEIEKSTLSSPLVVTKRTPNRVEMSPVATQSGRARQQPTSQDLVGGAGVVFLVPSVTTNENNNATQSGVYARRLGNQNLASFSGPFYIRPDFEARRPSRSRSSWYLTMVGSAAIVSGGLMARSALNKLHEWEQQSNEDSLAYDLAYTNSDVSYGSFRTDFGFAEDSDRFDI